MQAVISWLRGGAEKPSGGRRRKSRWPLVVGLVAFGGLAAATIYATLPRQDSDPGNGPPAAGSQAQAALLARGDELLIPAAERPSAPDIELRTASYADGSVFELSEERGNVVALYFMAAWCTTCIPEARALADLHEAYADRGLRILVLDVEQRETEQDLAGFRQRAGSGNYLWAMDRDFHVAQPYNVRALDTTIFIDREGNVAYGDAAPTTYRDLASVTEALLQ